MPVKLSIVRYERIPHSLPFFYRFLFLSRSSLWGFHFTFRPTASLHAPLEPSQGKGERAEHLDRCRMQDTKSHISLYLFAETCARLGCQNGFQVVSNARPNNSYGVQGWNALGMICVAQEGRESAPFSSPPSRGTYSTCLLSDDRWCPASIWSSSCPLCGRRVFAWYHRFSRSSRCLELVTTGNWRRVSYPDSAMVRSERDKRQARLKIACCYNPKRAWAGTLSRQGNVIHHAVVSPAQPSSAQLSSRSPAASASVPAAGTCQATPIPGQARPRRRLGTRWWIAKGTLIFKHVSDGFCMWRCPHPSPRPSRPKNTSKLRQPGTSHNAETLPKETAVSLSVRHAFSSSFSHSVV